MRPGFGVMRKVAFMGKNTEFADGRAYTSLEDGLPKLEAARWAGSTSSPKGCEGAKAVRKGGARTGISPRPSSPSEWRPAGPAR